MDDGQKTRRGHPDFNSYVKNLCVLVFQMDGQTDRQTEINLEEPVRVAIPTRINLEEPISSGYPAHLGLTWRNRQVTQPNQDYPGGTRQGGQPNQD